MPIDIFSYPIYARLSMAATTLMAIVVPLQVAFGIEMNGPLFYVNIGLSLFLVWEAVVRVRQYRNPPAGMERPALVLVIGDVLGALPLGLIFSFPLAGLLRLLKLSNANVIMRNWRRRNFRIMDRLRLVHTVYWMLLILHTIACGWYGLGGIPDSDTMAHGYIDSMYWAITTIGTVGYGDITPTTYTLKIYAMLTMLTGVGFYGYLIGNISTILSKQDPRLRNYLDNLDRLAFIAKAHRMPNPLEKRIFEFYTYNWERGEGYYESDFLESLPMGLRRDVSMHMKRKVIGKVPIFSGASAVFLQEVCLRLHTSVFTPGEFVFHADEVGDRMYFLIRGRVAVLAPHDQSVITELSEGNFFGEIALVENTSRTASIRTITACELFYLTKKDFDFVLNRFPNIAAQIRENVSQRIEENRRNFGTTGPSTGNN